MIKGNLAHGYLFDNQFEKAKAIYLENKDAKLQDGRDFSQAALDDFKEFQDAGITHPDMEKIKALLTSQDSNPRIPQSRYSPIPVRLFARRTAVIIFAFHLRHAGASADAGDHERGGLAQSSREPISERNKTYEALMSKLSDTENKEKLKESQRAWLVFEMPRQRLRLTGTWRINGSHDPLRNHGGTHSTANQTAKGQAYLDPHHGLGAR